MHSSTLLLLSGAASLACAQQSTPRLSSSHHAPLAKTRRGHDHGVHELDSPTPASSEPSDSFTISSSTPSSVPSYTRVPSKAPGVPPLVDLYTSVAKKPTGWIDAAPQVATTDPFTTSFTKTLTPGSKATDLIGLGIPPLTDGMCYPMAAGHGPKPSADTTLAFLENPEFSQLANRAAQPVNYTRDYVDEHAASFSTTAYLMYLELESYDPVKCSAQCNDVPVCKAFNIFFERKPTLQLGPNCPTSSSSTAIKCVLWAMQLDRRDATNRGYLNREFEVVIAGSNAYNRVPDAPAHVKSIATPVAVTMVLLLVSLAIGVIGGGWLLMNLHEPQGED